MQVQAVQACWKDRAAFKARSDVSTMLPAEKGGRRSTDVDQKMRADGADSITAEL